MDIFELHLNAISKFDTSTNQNINIGEYFFDYLLKMLSNQIVGNHKLVLFIDEVGIERNSSKIMEMLLKEQNVLYELFDEHLSITSKKAVVLPPLSKLEVNHSESYVVDIIQSLKVNKNVSQIFVWATIKNVQLRLLVPFVEHISDVVITIKSKEVLSILTRRKFGSTKLKEYHHELLQGKSLIKELKLDNQKQTQAEPTINPESIGTFKIGEYNQAELEAKNKLKLPFELV